MSDAGPPPDKPGAMQRAGAVLRRLSPLIGVVLFGLALWVLHGELAQYHYREVIAHLRGIPLPQVAAAVGLTVLNYALLVGYDVLALHYLGRPMPARKVVLGAFIGYAFSNSVGYSLLSGASVRYRFYSASGLSVLDIARLMAFNLLTFWLGFTTVAGVVFTAEPVLLPAALHLPFESAHPLGWVLLAAVAGVFALTALRKAPLHLRGIEIPLPSPRLTAMQATLSSLDWVLAGSVFFVLLPAGHDLSLPIFLGVFLLGHAAGLLSTIPGGLGVFESVVLLCLSGRIPAGQLFGTLLAYRVTYYLFPLIAGVLALAIHEVGTRAGDVRKAARRVRDWTPRVAPQMLGLLMFLSGAVLLASGATPGVEARIAWMKTFVPLPVLELSHLLGSLIGVALLILSWGIRRRVDAAYHLSVGLLTAGIVVSLLKGGDYEEAAILGALLAALLPARRNFYRRASLLHERMRPGWAIAVLLAVGGTSWLGVFSYKHVEYSHDLWWHFSLSGDASRFLRASLGVVVALIAWALLRLLRPAIPARAKPGEPDLQRASAILAGARTTQPLVALLGDKSFLFDPSGTAMIQYAVEGRSWVAMGDPIGPDARRVELAWDFRNLVDRHDGWTVFYQVGPESLPLYLDLGLSMLKLGEEAQVSLPGFNLDGPDRKELRYVRRRLDKEGIGFEVVPAAQVPAILPELRAISDAWLAEKHTREKGFSLGFFDDAYLARFPMALVKRDGRIVAFSNVWTAADHEELSVDLMRHLPDAPPLVMDYLFIRLMQWGGEQGFARFNLGMAPLSGLEHRALAPAWPKLGGYLFRHGEHFYNFQGLRAYKEKFGPTWRPMYLASPGGLALPVILANVAALVSRGLKGVVSK